MFYEYLTRSQVVSVWSCNWCLTLVNILASEHSLGQNKVTSWLSKSNRITTPKVAYFFQSSFHTVRIFILTIFSDKFKTLSLKVKHYVTYSEQWKSLETHSKSLFTQSSKTLSELYFLLISRNVTKLDQVGSELVEN